MKKLISTLIATSLLTACSGGGDAVPTDTVSTLNIPENTPVSEPTPSPTPSPSPSPAPYAFGGGSGTLADPYKLDTMTDVEHISDFPAAVYTVTQDINMNGSSMANVDFSGVLRGNLHQLYNLSVVSLNNQPTGLFGVVSGTINQLTLVGTFAVNGSGHVAAFATQLSGSITNSRVTGTITNPSPTYPIASTKSEIVTLEFATSGPRSVTGTSYDVMYNGVHYTGKLT